MNTPWEKFTNDVIRDIAGEIEKDRRTPEIPLRPEKAAAKLNPSSENSNRQVEPL